MAGIGKKWKRNTKTEDKPEATEEQSRNTEREKKEKRNEE